MTASLPPPPLDHLWSLVIEEQFYLIWPLVMWIFIFRLNGRRACLWATLLAASLPTLATALLYSPDYPGAMSTKRL